MNFTVFTEYRTDYNIYIYIYIYIYIHIYVYQLSSATMSGEMWLMWFSIVSFDQIHRSLYQYRCVSVCRVSACLFLSVSVCLSVYPSLSVCLSLSRLVRSLALYIYICIYGGGLCAGVWLQCTIGYTISKRMIWIKFPSTCISWEIMLGWCRRKSRWYIYTDFSNGLVPSDQVNYNSAAPLFHRASCIHVFHRCSNNISKKIPLWLPLAVC